MLAIRLTLLLITLLLVTPALHAHPQDSTYTLAVPVDEVDLTFHAIDTHNLAVNDLKLTDFTLLDNDNPPGKILAFQSFQDLPIRAGILMDTSTSMAPHLPSNRAIALQYARSLLRQQTDQAFIMDFGHLSRLLQPWTSDKAALTKAIGWISTSSESRVAGTAIFDTLYRTCRAQFGSINRAASGNFILLFSDGEDNASFMRLSQAVDACQHTNTAIYAFRSEEPSTFGSPVHKRLRNYPSKPEAGSSQPTAPQPISAPTCKSSKATSAANITSSSNPHSYSTTDPSTASRSKPPTASSPSTSAPATTPPRTDPKCRNPPLRSHRAARMSKYA